MLFLELNDLLFLILLFMFIGCFVVFIDWQFAAAVALKILKIFVELEIFFLDQRHQWENFLMLFLLLF